MPNRTRIKSLVALSGKVVTPSNSPASRDYQKPSQDERSEPNQALGVGVAPNNAPNMLHHLLKRACAWPARASTIAEDLCVLLGTSPRTDNASTQQQIHGSETDTHTHTHNTDTEHQTRQQTKTREQSREKHLSKGGPRQDSGRTNSRQRASRQQYKQKQKAQS